MKSRYSILVLIVIICFCQCKSSQEIKFNDGKCYAKCKVPYDVESEEYTEYAIYTGNKSKEVVDLEVKEIIIQEKSRKWVKRRVNNNCMSSDPNDCMVWCLEEKPEIKETRTILLDTTQSKNFDLKRFYSKTDSNKTEKIAWKEVVCEKNITKPIVSQIQNSLRERQFYIGDITGSLDSSTKNALKSFQEKNKLPIGQLDLETLDVLGVVVNSSL